MEYVRQEFSAKRVTGSTATTLATGRTLLHNFVINASSGQVLVFDGTAAGVAGSAIAVVGSGLSIGVQPALDMILANGLTLWSTAANTDITVLFANN